MGSAFHQLCPRYSGTLTPRPLRLLSYGTPLPFFNHGNTLSINKASQAIQSPRTVPFFLLVSLLDGYSFPNVLVKGIVAFEH